MKFTSLALFATAVSAFAIPDQPYFEKFETNPNTAGPDPNTVFVQSLTYGGSGCPQGTVSQNFNDDRTAFTLLFDSYVASMGPGVPLTESRKNCQLNIGLRIPQGWQYSWATVDYRGYMNLDAGVTATQSATYYFQGSQMQSRLATNFRGPADRDYILSDAFPVETLVWSDCGARANVNINSAISVSGPRSSQGLMTTDSIDGKVKQIYSMQWRRC